MNSTLNPKPYSLHIGIDGNEANVSKRVGSNQYAFGILWGMYSLHPEDIQMTVYLKSAPLDDLPDTKACLFALADIWQNDFNKTADRIAAAKVYMDKLKDVIGDEDGRRVEITFNVVRPGEDTD